MVPQLGGTNYFIACVPEKLSCSLKGREIEFRVSLHRTTQIEFHLFDTCLPVGDHYESSSHELSRRIIVFRGVNPFASRCRTVAFPGFPFVYGVGGTSTMSPIERGIPPV